MFRTQSDSIFIFCTLQNGLRRFTKESLANLSKLKNRLLFFRYRFRCREILELKDFEHLLASFMFESFGIPANKNPHQETPNSIKLLAERFAELLFDAWIEEVNAKKKFYAKKSDSILPS